jgi:hypothetical protein
MGEFMTELFSHAHSRFRPGFLLQLGRAVGATFPFLIEFVAQKMSLEIAIGTFGAVAYGVVIMAALTLPETRGTSLDK